MRIIDHDIDEDEHLRYMCMDESVPLQHASEQQGNSQGTTVLDLASLNACMIQPQATFQCKSSSATAGHALDVNSIDTCRS